MKEKNNKLSCFAEWKTQVKLPKREEDA